MNSARKQSRREVLKTFTVLSAVSVVAGRRWIATVLAQVGPASGGVLRIRISDYPALQQTGGSVRIGTSALQTVSTDCRKPVGLFFPFIITRGTGTVFHALSAECTHEGCTVPTYNSSLGYSQCPKHGSRFAMDGTALRGPPGDPLPPPLISYTTRFDGVDTLSVDNPDMAFDLITLGVQTGAGDRLSLEFKAFEAIEYEVHHQATLTDPRAPVVFATSPAGPADQTVFVGPQFGTIATLYVDRPTLAGFYSIVMRIRIV